MDILLIISILVFGLYMSFLTCHAIIMESNCSFVLWLAFVMVSMLSEIMIGRLDYALVLSAAYSVPMFIFSLLLFLSSFNVTIHNHVEVIVSWMRGT